MTEEAMGQSDAGIHQGTTAQEPQVNEQKTSAGTAEEETFFDPSMIEGKPELQAAYKQMQGAFTKKMQSFSSNKEKIAAYDAFMSNPQETIRQLAQQHGIQLVDKSEQSQFEPKNWDDVISHFKQEAKREILQELQPALSDIRNVKKQSIESYLDSSYPDWRNYENEMMDVVQQHPTLASNPDLLYKLAVPDAVIQQRARQQAMQKLKGQTETSKMTGNTSNARKTAPMQKAGSFNEAVRMAQEQLREQGLRPPTY